MGAVVAIVGAYSSNAPEEAQTSEGISAILILMTTSPHFPVPADPSHCMLGTGSRAARTWEKTLSRDAELTQGPWVQFKWGVSDHN